MRDGANRAFGYAVLASIALHAVLFAALPQLREFSALIPPEPAPLIARVERPKPPPAPMAASAPKPAVEPKPKAKPTPKPKPAPKPAAEPLPLPEPAHVEPAVPSPLELPPPTAPADPAPLPQAAKAQPVPEPTPVPAPLTRVDPRVLAHEVRPSAAEDAGVLERYRLDVVSAATRFKRYPRVAIDNHWEGEVVVRMSVGADGRIAGIAVARSSGYEVLDRQALQMFRNAKPFVPIPSALRGQPFEVELRAIYNLRDQGSG